MKVEGFMRVGFVVNPIAGMGGRARLKGTVRDWKDTWIIVSPIERARNNLCRVISR